MMDQLLNNEQLWIIVAGFLGGAVGLAVVALASKYAAGWFREAWDRIHGQMDTIIEAVDDPTDALIIWLDGYIPGKADKVLAAALPAFLRAVADAIEANAPEKEVSVDQAVG